MTTADNLRKMLDAFGPEGEHWSNLNGLTNYSIVDFEERAVALAADDLEMCLIGGRNFAISGKPWTSSDKEGHIPGSTLSYRYPYRDTPESLALWKALPKQEREKTNHMGPNGRTWQLVLWNDRRERTWKDVRKLIKKAIKKLEKKS